MGTRAMAESQPESGPAIQHYLQWVEKANTRRAGCKGSDNAIGYHYIPQTVLEEYMTAERIKTLLAELFDGTNRIPPNYERVRINYLRPFAILLSAGFGRMIRHFMDRRGLQDANLPFTSEPGDFPKSTTGNLYKIFCEKQWQFCAVRLEYDMSDHLEDDYILPILEKVEIGNGGSAILYKITVDEGYNHLIPGGDSSDSTTRPCPNTFALKTYRTPEAAKYFENETNAFIQLRYGDKPPANIIEFYGSFVREGTYNIILEYADRRTLDDYMRDTPEPTSISEISTFWEQLFAVLRGLVQIHGTQRSATDGPNILLGWHHDIDPSNILVVSKNQGSLYDCDFKIADLGLMHFKRYMLGDNTDNNRYGTNTYSAPETYRSTDLERLHLQVPQNADIWSMGCVLSEVATWVTQGRRKLDEYRRRRKQEIGQKTKTLTPNEDRFHYLSEVLDTVKQIHTEIIESSRGNDFITPRVIERLVNGMIRTDPKARGQAQFLLASSTDILDEAKAKLKKAVPNTPAPNPDHTMSDTVIDVRKRRLPPTRPPDQENSVPSEPFETPLDVTVPTQAADFQVRPLNPPPWDHDHVQQGVKHPQLSEDFLKQDKELYGEAPSTYIEAQYDGAYTPRQPRRILSQPTSSNLQSRQHERSFTKTAGVAGPFPRGNSQDIIANGLAGSDVSLRTFQPRGLGATPSEAAELDQGSGDEVSSKQARHRRSDQLTTNGRASDTLDVSKRNSIVESSSSGQHQRPQMSLDAGLAVKREKERGRPAKYPHEHVFQTLDTILRKRDHVFLIDNAKTMAIHRQEVRDVLELLTYLTQRYDPDGLDIYFTTQSDKLRPKTNKQVLGYFDERPANGFPDFRQRFASIIEKYQKKFGKRNIVSKALHFSSTPSKGPRPLSLYVLTDGIWDPKCNLITEIKNLVALLQEHRQPNKYVGIQFIRFGNDPEAKKRLRKLDRELGLELDVADTTSAAGNVYKWLLGAVNDWFDGDGEDTEEED